MIFARQRLVPGWTDAFYQRFPHLFADTLTATESVSPLTDWGIECRIGWKKIVQRLCGDLEAMIAALPEAERKEYRATQVKQKFGTLRFYMSRYTDAMTKRIEQAENETMTVCELCGGPDEDGKPCRTKH